MTTRAARVLALLRRAVCVAAILAVLSTLSTAAAQTWLPVARDRGGVPINKDVGSEGRAITSDLATQSATGNVLFRDNRDPAFVWRDGAGTDDSQDLRPPPTPVALRLRELGRELGRVLGVAAMICCVQDESMRLRVLWLLLFLMTGIAACTRPSGGPLPAMDPLPGAEAFSPELRTKLASALAAKEIGYRARTRHRRSDDSPRYTNRLILETSPYLLQHAHNPVNWYPWSDEAFETAKRLGRPVLLSVGYSTCHWCHVMEEESFDDEEIADYLNRNYVAVKVDRELRPDVDETYMSVVQMLTGGGGWPMTVWLTPLREPFFGGTYFPPRDGARGADVGFLTVLKRLREAFDEKPLQVAAQASQIAERVRQIAAATAGAQLPGPAPLHAAFRSFRARFDAVHGGFGGAPKFPTPPTLEFLLRYHRHTGDEQALAMVTQTLAKMAAGGIHDHVGGGFHRYATDAAWRVPHFEKMLYDNAQLARVYLAGYQVTKREDFARVTRDVLDYVSREMTAPEGGFYAATDADSEGEEGRFFVWTPAEIRAVLDEAQAQAVLAYYTVTEQGNFHGRTILHVSRSLADVARELSLQPSRLAALLDEARPRLLSARQRREPPHKDDKILAAWNGLMISAFARAGVVLHETGYVDRARAAAGFVLGRMRPDGSLKRSFAGGAADEDAFLDDYAFLASGLLDLYEATFDLTWLREAITLQETLAREFWDDEHGGFFLTGAAREVTLARHKPDDDGALPSGNAVAVANLLRLAEFTANDEWRARADDTLRALARRLERGPAGAPALLSALDFRLDRPKEIVIVRPAGADAGADPLVETVRATYLPNSVLTVASEGDEADRQRELIPLVDGKRALGGVATAYVCERQVCALPTSDATVLTAQLAKVRPLPDS